MAKILSTHFHIFDQALQHTSDQDRTEFLDEACAGKPELRKTIDQLLFSTLGITEFSRRVSWYHHEPGRYPPNYHRYNNRPL